MARILACLTVSRAVVLGDALDEATSRYLKNARSPSREVGELDNRGSTFYLALYWARALAEQRADDELARHFDSVDDALTKNEERIIAELNDAQGEPQELGGYYLPDRERSRAAMRPSGTFNEILVGV